MRKKETITQATEAENKEKLRRDVINDFNTNNMGKYWIDANKVPTDEDVEQAKKEFEDFVTNLREKKDYIVADKDNALRVAKFMQKIIDKSVWSGMEFVGVLNFHALMQDFIDGFKEDEPADLALEYGAMEFAYLMFSKRGGVGIESANEAAEENDEFIPIFDKLHELHDWFEVQKKKAENYKLRWGMFAQGYYVHILEYMDEDGVAPNTEEETTQEETKSE